MPIRRLVQNPAHTTLSRDERLLWIGAVGLWLVGDLVTTILGVSIGLIEGNYYVVVLAYWFGVDPITVLLVSKLSVLAVTGSVFAVLVGRGRILIPLSYVGVGGAVVAWNLWQISLVVF